MPEDEPTFVLPAAFVGCEETIEECFDEKAIADAWSLGGYGTEKAVPHLSRESIGIGTPSPSPPQNDTVETIWRVASAVRGIALASVGISASDNGSDLRTTKKIAVKSGCNAYSIVYNLFKLATL